jgi:hypothetical protein
MRISGDFQTHDLANVILAAVVATLGLLIGAFGASFEQQHFFRHVAHVDEEI